MTRRKRTRTYAEPWNVLKSMGSVTMKIVGVDLTTAAVTKWAKTYRKAMQKEKYNDDAFRIRYPNAKIESVVDYENAAVRFTLKLNHYENITEDLFDVNTERKTSGFES